MEVLGLPADLDIPVTEEHLRVLKPVFNKDDADPYRLVARYDKQHYASCTLSTLIRLAEQTTPNYALNNPTRWCQTDRYRKLSIQPNPKENWDGMDRVRDCWSGCEWAYPALERYYNPIRLLRDEYRRGGLPETFHYPIHTTKGEYRLAKGQISPPRNNPPQRQARRTHVQRRLRGTIHRPDTTRMVRHTLTGKL